MDDKYYNSVKDKIKNMLPVFYSNIDTEVGSTFYTIVMATIYVMKEKEHSILYRRLIETPEGIREESDEEFRIRILKELNEG